MRATTRRPLDFMMLTILSVFETELLSIDGVKKDEL